jgi:hypothetical protein
MASGPATRLAFALLLAAGLTSCTHNYRVEERETPVHVWIVAPALAATGGSIKALVYVGAEKAVDGTVRFPPGVSTVVLPTLHLRAGNRLVQAVMDQGTIVGSETVTIEGESWIQVQLSGRSVRIVHSEEQPLIPR